MLLAASIVGMLAIASIWAGSLLLRRNQRGVTPSIWLLLVQSVRVVAPLVVWLVSLGWTIDLVLVLWRRAAKVMSRQGPAQASTT